MRSHEHKVVMLVHDAVEHRFNTTAGYCGVGAWMVTQLLDAVMMDAPGHWYAKSRVTGEILDPTVDQFATSPCVKDAMEDGRLVAEESLYPHGMEIDATTFPNFHYSPREWEWAEAEVERLRSRVRKAA